MTEFFNKVKEYLFLDTKTTITTSVILGLALLLIIACFIVIFARKKGFGIFCLSLATLVYGAIAAIVYISFLNTKAQQYVNIIFSYFNFTINAILFSIGGATWLLLFLLLIFVKGKNVGKIKKKSKEPEQVQSEVSGIEQSEDKNEQPEITEELKEETVLSANEQSSETANIQQYEQIEVTEELKEEVVLSDSEQSLEIANVQENEQELKEETVNEQVLETTNNQEDEQLEITEELKEEEVVLSVSEQSLETVNVQEDDQIEISNIVLEANEEKENTEIEIQAVADSEIIQPISQNITSDSYIAENTVVKENINEEFTETAEVKEKQNTETTLPIATTTASEKPLPTADKKPKQNKEPAKTSAKKTAAKKPVEKKSSKKKPAKKAAPKKPTSAKPAMQKKPAKPKPIVTQASDADIDALIEKSRFTVVNRTAAKNAFSDYLKTLDGEKRAEVKQNLGVRTIENLE